MLLAYIIAMIAYIIVGLHLYWALVRTKAIAKGFTLGMLTVGLLAHSVLLYPQIATTYGLNFNLFNIFSLTSCFFLLFYLMFSLYRPILSLGVLAIPSVITGLSLGYFGVAPYSPLTNISIWLEIHIILSIAAYCMLLMAAIQAVLMRFQIRDLKHKTVHRYWVNKLPPLQSMESVLFDMILAGFVILTVALPIGFIYVNDLMAQHLAHKAALSIISWLIFGGLLIGHWLSGWRGRRAANMTIVAFVLLAIGFMGSKFVLEMVLPA